MRNAMDGSDNVTQTTARPEPFDKAQDMLVEGRGRVPGSTTNGGNTSP
jgi:hypothetical protein